MRSTWPSSAVRIEAMPPTIRLMSVKLPEGGTLDPRRTDRDFFSGDIGQEMFQYLNNSRFALVDITGLNPNVMYEIGVRHAVRFLNPVVRYLQTVLRQDNLDADMTTGVTIRFREFMPVGIRPILVPVT